MKYIKQLCALLALVSISFAQEKPDKNEQGDYFLLKITLKILEEDGTPLKDADVHVAVENFIEYEDGTNDFRGKSDENGLFQVESKGQKGIIIGVTKPGYYPSSSDYYPPYELNKNFKSGNKLQPWNPTISIMLKKIGKPIPMIVRLGLSSSAYIYRAPKLGEEVGFDMIKGDWVRPNGKGEVADLFIRFNSEFLSPENYKTEATIRFSNSDDGLLPITELIGEESALKYPRIALENGYETKLLTVKTPVSEARSEAKERQPLGYLFRIRTVRDTVTKKMTSAQYGKIIGRQQAPENSNPFEFNTMNRNQKRNLVLDPSFTFSYYLNPTPNDRNIEYDQQNNLAPEADKGVTLAP